MSIPEAPVDTFPLTNPFLLRKGDHSQNLQHHRLGQPVFELFKTAIIRHILLFSIWLLDVMLVRFIHTVACSGSVFIFFADYYSFI